MESEESRFYKNLVKIEDLESPGFYTLLSGFGTRISGLAVLPVVRLNEPQLTPKAAVRWRANH